MSVYNGRYCANQSICRARWSAVWYDGAVGRFSKTAGRRKAEREVALAFPIAPAHLFAVTRGVTDYAGRHGQWLLTTHGESANLPIQQLRGWKGDGIIAILTSPADALAARKFQAGGIPVVTFSAALPRPGVPRVRTNSQTIGQLAAEHLLHQKYPHFGLYGLHGVAYSIDRGKAFVERLCESGNRCSSLVSPNTFSLAQPWENEIATLIGWLRTLDLPCGIFAVNDYRAQLVVSACKAAGLRVPRDIGVIGADNNHVICEFTSPNLSSVDCNWYRVGQQAADLLDHLMNGGPAPEEDRLVEPVGVIQRASTDRTAADDPRLHDALDYVRDHLGEVFGVERLVAISNVPRRTLEMIFLKELGCTPYDFICRQRIAKAKALLQTNENRSLTEISAQCGFHDLRRFREVFRRIEKVSPANFRLLRQGKV